MADAAAMAAKDVSNNRLMNDIVVDRRCGRPSGTRLDTAKLTIFFGGSEKSCNFAAGKSYTTGSPGNPSDLDRSSGPGLSGAM